MGTIGQEGLSDSVITGNRSTVFQLIMIGALGPMIYFNSFELGKNDFAVFWIAGTQAISGDALNVYNLTATGIFTRQHGLGEGTIFPYPPHALYVFMPFAVFSHPSAYVAWVIASVAFFYVCARPYCRNYFPAAWSVLSPAAIACIAFGQTGLLFGGLWLLAFQRKWTAVAFLTFKPHLGLLSVFALRSRSDLLKATLLMAVIIVGTLITFGSQIWQSFLEHSLGHGAKIASMARWKHLGVTPAIGYGVLGWIPFAVIGGLLLVRNVNVFTAATASFLVSPYGFNYDMSVVCLGFGLIIAAHWHLMPLSHRLPVALGFLSPAIAIIGTWWVPPLLCWALWAQVKYSVETTSSDEVPQAGAR